jgi:hypothetical protein
MMWDGAFEVHEAIGFGPSLPGWEMAALWLGLMAETVAVLSVESEALDYVRHRVWGA